jgi:hypothetical protein
MALMPLYAAQLGAKNENKTQKSNFFLNTRLLFKNV